MTIIEVTDKATSRTVMLAVRPARGGATGEIELAVYEELHGMPDLIITAYAMSRSAGIELENALGSVRASSGT